MIKIYRLTNEKDKKIAGICAGLGDAFKIDPTIVRLAAVFLAIITGVFPLVITYAAGWWLIPEKDQTTRSVQNGDLE
jgi:phage shock protein C